MKSFSKNKKRKKDYLRLFFNRIIIICLFVIGLWYLWNSPFWYIQSIDIKGITKYNQKITKNIIKNENIYNKHILLLNPIKLRKQFINYPLIEDVEIRRWLFPLPAKVEISIIEKKPWMKIYFKINQDNRYNEVLIDKNGTILPLPPNQKVESIIPAKFIISTDSENINLNKNQIKTIKLIDKYYNEGDLLKPAEFDITNPYNIILQMNNNKVNIGSVIQLPVKIKILSLMKNKIDEYKENLDYIDLRFWENPVLKIK